MALSPIEALGRLFPCHFPPVWLGEAGEPHTEVIEEVVSQVPCYLLRNRLGGRAVDLVLEAGGAA